MSNTKNSTFRLVGLSVLTAIIVVLQVVTTYFPTKPFAITLALVPIVIGAAIYGPKAGAYLGAVFSVVVIAMCIFGVDAGGFLVWQANPVLCVLVCMLKGTLAGLCAGLVYSALKEKNKVLAVVLAAIVEPVVNTGIFIAGLALFFNPLLSSWASAAGQDAVTFIFMGLTGINFIVELAVNMVLAPVIVKIIDAVKKSKA